LALPLLAGLLCLSAADGQVPVRSPGWLPDAARYDRPILPGRRYDADVPTPADLLGFDYGTRPARPAQVAACLRRWETSPRMRLFEYARSHEQRPLYYAVITSQRNQQRLDAIRAALDKLADPRKLAGENDAERLLRETPAVAWLAYSIHGDELSGVDAALGVIYHLIACRDEDVADLLDDLVVIVDPMMNPDGRARILGMLEQASGYTPNLDARAVQHQGRWPFGRGNHYLFDLNRDWLLGVHPETRGRQRAVAEWHPQLFVDAHEMGPHDTYLFNPPRMPFNPYLPPSIRKWWDIFGDEQGAAFDRFGWSYYTREWVEFWYPGYSDAWASYHGAIGVLYEQASTGGSPIRQRRGRILTYREAVHHQFVSSLANLDSLRKHREQILRDYLADRRHALAGPQDSSRVVFLLPPTANASRRRALLDVLRTQGIEIGIAREPFAAHRGNDALGDVFERREFPTGTAIISRRQPLGGLVAAALDFDIHTSDAFLKWERAELEKKRESKVYDVTAWSLPLAYALESYWCDAIDDVPQEPYTPQPAPRGAVEESPDDGRVYGYVVDGSDDAVAGALAWLLMADLTVRVAEKPFTAGGQTYPPGSLLLRVEENEDAERLQRVLAEAAEASGIAVRAVSSARSPDEGPDLGGRHFIQLSKPRVGLFGGSGVDFTSYGSIWHLFDRVVGLPLSLLDAGSRFGLDLRDYNVLILPDTFGPAEGLLKPLLDDLKPWVRNGGTLIAVGSSAVYLADEKIGLSQVRRRRDVLDRLDEYARAVQRERSAGTVPPDPDNVWGAGVESQPATQPQSDAKPSDEAAQDEDEWRRVFSPSGVILRAELDTEHWLTFGCPDQMPVFVAGSDVLLSKHPVATPVRLASRERLRLSGLLWPEAATRLADSAYATVERVGNGQVILFAQEPDFRGTWYGTRRLLINAVLLGPGCGTSQPMAR